MTGLSPFVPTKSVVDQPSADTDYVQLFVVAARSSSLSMAQPPPPPPPEFGDYNLHQVLDAQVGSDPLRQLYVCGGEGRTTTSSGRSVYSSNKQPIHETQRLLYCNNSSAEKLAKNPWSILFYTLLP